MSRRANYALVYVGAHLGPHEQALDIDWATFVGDRTAPYEFDVPTGDATDAYVGLQVFDVNEYGHEILVNDEPLGGFDLPPRVGWQYWIDSLTDTSLVEGTNTIQIVRDGDSDDSFAVGNVTIHWREPVEE